MTITDYRIQKDDIKEVWDDEKFLSLNDDMMFTVKKGAGVVDDGESIPIDEIVGFDQFEDLCLTLEDVFNDDENLEPGELLPVVICIGNGFVCISSGKIGDKGDFYFYSIELGHVRIASNLEEFLSLVFEG